MNNEFYQLAGILAIGSRLRQFTEQITLDSASIYRLNGLNFEPRWFPVFYMLSAVGPLHVSDLAERIGQSHAAVSQTAKVLQREGLLHKVQDKVDARKSLLSLSEQGLTVAKKMSTFYEDVNKSVTELLRSTKHNFWAALQELETALEADSLYTRVKYHQRIRMTKHLQIVPYEARYAQAFRDINVEWIEKYFTMEAADYQVLDHPQTYILDKGGYIFVALLDDEPIGVVAMIKMAEADTYELAKMGVRPQAQGKGVGYLLGEAVKAKAKELDAKRIYLESNARLQPALRLYRKLGFSDLPDHIPSPYARANVQMELWL